MPPSAANPVPRAETSSPSCCPAVHPLPCLSRRAGRQAREAAWSSHDKKEIPSHATTFYICSRRRKVPVPAGWYGRSERCRGPRSPWASAAATRKQQWSRQGGSRCPHHEGRPAQEEGLEPSWDQWDVRGGTKAAISGVRRRDGEPLSMSLTSSRMSSLRSTLLSCPMRRKEEGVN